MDFAQLIVFKMTLN